MDRLRTAARRLPQSPAQQQIPLYSCLRACTTAFSLNPPLTNRQVFLPDEIPDSVINLIGSVIDALHYCLCTFVEVGCRHLIRVCGEFELEWLDLFSGKLSENLFKGQSQMIRI